MTGTATKRARVPQEIVDRFDEACAHAFEEMFQSMRELVRRERDLRLGLTGNRIKIEFDDGFSGSPEKRAQVHERASAIIGRCGARVAAAMKHAQRQLIMMVLLRARDKRGVDVTPAVAHRVARDLLGRGVEREALNAVFGMPGRTAAHKSRALIDAKQVKSLDIEKENFERLNAAFCETAGVIRNRERWHWYARWTAFRRDGVDIGGANRYIG